MTTLPHRLETGEPSGQRELLGLPSHHAKDANNLARKAWAALKRGRGMRLTADEVSALHAIESDGDWWQSFNPACIRAKGVGHAE